MTKTFSVTELSKNSINLTNHKTQNKSKQQTGVWGQDQLIHSGLHLGHTSLKLKSAWHRSVSTFLLGGRNSSAIFKNKYTLTLFLKAFYILTLIIKSGGDILIVNTNPEFSRLLNYTKKNTKSSQIFYSDCDWVGGTLTNWGEISQSVDTFINFYYKFDDFLLKNNIHFPRYKKMKKSFKGFINPLFRCPTGHGKSKSSKRQQAVSSESQVTVSLEQGFKACSLSTFTLPKHNVKWQEKQRAITFLNDGWKPDLVFILDSNGTEAVIKEASRLQIPTIALTDSNTNISNITYPIPTNSNSLVFAWFCLDWISRTINKYSTAQYTSW